MMNDPGITNRIYKLIYWTRDFNFKCKANIL